MTYQKSPFGDGTSTGSGGNVTQDVHNHYGPRETDGPDGEIKTYGAKSQAEYAVTVEQLNGATTFDRWLVQPFIPAGAVIENVYVKVTEAFTLTGTTPTILFGTEGSEVTNGFVISEAQAEAVGTYDVTSTLTGTWAAPLAAKTDVDVVLGGTTPAATGTAGRLEVVIVYAKV